MPKPRINLIKNMVPPPELRRRQYLFFVSYLMICGIALVMVINTSTKQLLRAFEQGRIIRQLEALHKQSHTGSSGMVPFASQAESSLRYMSRQMDLIHKVTDQYTFPATIMFNLISELPSGAFIGSLSLNQEERTLQFNLNVPIRADTTGANPDKFINVWNSKPDLMKIVQNIKAVRSERQRADRKFYYVMHFSGTLKKQGY